jgi:hypothetical protein
MKNSTETVQLRISVVRVRGTYRKKGLFTGKMVIQYDDPFIMISVTIWRIISHTGKFFDWFI